MTRAFLDLTEVSQGVLLLEEVDETRRWTAKKSIFGSAKISTRITSSNLNRVT